MFLAKLARAGVAASAKTKSGVKLVSVDSDGETQEAAVSVKGYVASARDLIERNILAGVTEVSVSSDTEDACITNTLTLPVGHERTDEVKSLILSTSFGFRKKGEEAELYYAPQQTKKTKASKSEVNA